MVDAGDGIAIPESVVEPVTMILLNAAQDSDRRQYVGKVIIYLDGAAVTNRAAWALMPEQPGVEAPGAVGLLPEPMTRDNHEPVATMGLVRWEWIEGNG